MKMLDIINTVHAKMMLEEAARPPIPEFIDHLWGAVEAAQVGFYFEEGGCWGMALALYDRFRSAGCPARLAVAYFLDRPSHALIQSGDKFYDYSGETTVKDRSKIRYVTPAQMMIIAQSAGYDEGEVMGAKSEAADIIDNAISAAGSAKPPLIP